MPFARCRPRSHAKPRAIQWAAVHLNCFLAQVFLFSFLLSVKNANPPIHIRA